MPCALRKWASICLLPFLTFKKMGLNMPFALRKWHFLIDRFPLYTLGSSENLQGTPARSLWPRSGPEVQDSSSSLSSSSPSSSSTTLLPSNLPNSSSLSHSTSPSRVSQAPVPTPMPASPAGPFAPATTQVRLGTNSMFPVAKSLDELTRLLNGPSAHPIVLSTEGYFAMSSSTLEVFLSSVRASPRTDLGALTNITSSNIPTARDQNELKRLHLDPLAPPIVRSSDGFYAVPSSTLVTLFGCKLSASRAGPSPAAC